MRAKTGVKKWSGGHGMFSVSQMEFYTFTINIIIACAT